MSMSFAMIEFDTGFKLWTREPFIFSAQSDP